MPLPSVEKYGAKRCTALSKRTKLPCKNPAAYGCKTCRYHGAKRSRYALSGQMHPQYKNGEFTKEKLTLKSEKSLQFLMLEELGHHIGLFAEGSTKLRGRKPKGFPYNLDLNSPEGIAKAIELASKPKIKVKSS